MQERYNKHRLLRARNRTRAYDQTRGVVTIDFKIGHLLY